MSYPKKKFSRYSKNPQSSNQGDEQNRDTPQDDYANDQHSEQELSPRAERDRSPAESTQICSFSRETSRRSDQSDESGFSRDISHDQLSSSTESSEENSDEGWDGRSHGHFKAKYVKGARSQRISSQEEDGAENFGSFGGGSHLNLKQYLKEEDKGSIDRPDTEEMAVLALLDLQCDSSPIKYEPAPSIPSQEEKETIPSPTRSRPVKTDSDDEVVDAVQCDSCEKWRKLPKGSLKKNLPASWFCHMNPDPRSARCDAPEETLSEHDEDAKAEADAIEEANENRRKLSKRKTRCGECDNCRRKNCGRCLYCKDMKCFGGRGTLRQACMHRKCEKRTRKFLVTEQQAVYDSDSDGNGQSNQTPHVASHGIVMPMPVPAPHQVNAMAVTVKKKRGRPTKKTENMEVANGSPFQSNMTTFHAEKKKKGDDESDFDDAPETSFHSKEFSAYNQRLIAS